MRWLPVLCAFAVLTGSAAEADLPIPSAEVIVSKVRREHPRLLATAADFAVLKKRIDSDPLLRKWHGSLLERAEKMLSDPPSKYEIPDGLRLLSVSRRVLSRVQTLALLYRTSGNTNFATRAWQELQAAAEFPDWNPRHFLDTAEMTRAFATGYDWLNDFWSEEQKTILRRAMIEKGLSVAAGVYKGGSRYGSWHRARHNWNQVCNGGIGMGALALLDEEPELCGELLQQALKSIQLPMREFHPDGAWAEGPGYWNYATAYNVAFLAALETALGTDFNLSSIDGFQFAGDFPIYLTGPLGRTFNYADGGDGTIRAPQMFWLAKKFAQPGYAAYEARVATPDALDLLWYQNSRTGSALPLNRYFRNAEIVSIRSAWNDKQALFVGFKAGDNKANHSHLDLGTFVLDAEGVRWAVDLGADNYNLPAYFGKNRWEYYRLRAEGHNTLVINPMAGPDQDPRAAAKIIKFDREAGAAVADLSAAYAASARKVQRGIRLAGQRQVLLQDEITTSGPAEIWWFLHTPAEVQLSGSNATLTLEGKKLVARILSPAGAKFSVFPAAPLESSPHPEGQNKNRGIQKLAISLSDVQNVRIAVSLESRGEPVPDITAASLTPLESW